VNGEYFLGYYDPKKQEPDYLKQSDNKLIPNIVWKVLNGEKVPTFAVKYTEGTSCEILKDTKREITVFYGLTYYYKGPFDAIYTRPLKKYQFLKLDQKLCDSMPVLNLFVDPFVGYKA
jgi:hypothetical protein